MPNKTDANDFDDIWNLDILDLKESGPEKIRGERYRLVVIDNFSKFEWRVRIRNRNAIAITNSHEKNLRTSKRKPNSIETDDGEEFVNIIFTDLLKKQY